MLFCFFEFNLQRITNPWVIAGLVLMLVGILLACSANSMAKLFENIMIAKNKQLTVNLKIVIKVIAFAVAFAGALTAIILA